MKTNHNKATPRVYHTLRQIVQRIPRWLIEKTANAVKWQIWTGLLTHLLLHCLKFLSGWDKAFSRLAGIVRSAAWMDLDIVETLRLYWDGITPAPTETALHPAVFGGLLTTRI